ncbi:MAG: IMP dehydrogenase [Alphaproteobacteria bacterium]|nr:IMP dehydrogenase [Alphaproteobacteria bacterium]
MEIRKALTFDDVLLRPAFSTILPHQAELKTNLTSKISLGIPLISAAMDTVTESKLAIAIAQAGGLGIIHKNLAIDQQADEVKKVKKFEAGMIVDPVTIYPDQVLADALELMARYEISGIPVVERATNKLVGILTHRDVRFARNLQESIQKLMTKDNLITVNSTVDKEHAKNLLHDNRIEKLLVVDENYRCTGLITVKDIEKAQNFPAACKDSHGRLCVGAAIGVGSKGLERAKALLDVGVDILVVDTAHGHSAGVLDTIHQLKSLDKKCDIIAGNIATAEAAEALIKAGVNAIKVGIGPGSICTTRIISGVGVPQLSAILETSEIAKKYNIPVISDGGIKYSGDIAKAIAAGADCVMIGSLFAGTDESPGDVVLYQGRSYKSYRGMGSLNAMSQGSADRYFQDNTADITKLVPEGVEGRVPYRGPVSNIIHQLVGGLQAAMGYTGNKTIKDMQEKCIFQEITASSLRESHVHDIDITHEAPNYRTDF